MRLFSMLLIIAILFMLPAQTIAAPFPIGFSAKAGIGSANYSMGELNDQMGILRQHYDGELVSVDGGFQVYVEGRVWFFNKFAAIIGYEHYWMDTDMGTGDFTLIYKAPADVLVLGGAVNIFKFPELVDINLGARGSFAKTTFETNELTEESNLDEYKKNAYGWDIFAEVTTSFLRPLEVGFMLGYRHLKMDGFEDKHGHPAIFSISDDDVVLDFSGTFFYFTAGVHLW
ncbi:MAG: hypothetical protein KAV42_05585 [Candidatus Krumholzibacteria bacterium]|nr:hypothetical protein [Candidatus Krumholzibacteria bacterium]